MLNADPNDTFLAKIPLLVKTLFIGKYVKLFYRLIYRFTG